MNAGSKASMVRFGVIAGFGLVGAIQPYRPIVVVGDSMSPTYKSGAVAISTAKIEEINRGDIVIVNVEGAEMVKRVAYGPGDVIPQIENSEGWSEVLDCLDPSRLRAMMRGNVRYVTVPENCYYLLGDNRVQSYDSRHYGFVNRAQIDRVLVNPNPYKAVEMPGLAGVRRLIAQR